MDPRSPRQGHLRGQVGGRAEAVDPEPATGWQFSPAQGPEADDARAQQRRQLSVGIAARQPVGVVGADDGVLGVAAVRVPAGVAGRRAQVLRAAPAITAGAVGLPQPGDAKAVTDGNSVDPATDRVDIADDFVSGDGTGPARPQVTFGEVQVGAADTAGRNLQPDLAGSRFGYRDDRPAQRPRRCRSRGGDLPADHRRCHAPDVPSSDRRLPVTCRYRSPTNGNAG